MVQLVGATMASKPNFYNIVYDMILYDIYIYIYIYIDYN